MTLRRPLVTLGAVTWLALSLAAPPAQSVSRDRPASRERMRTIFRALSTALNLSLYDTPFKAPENRAMIMDALEVLAENSAELDTHGGELNESFDYLRRSLARDANEAILRYRQAQYQGARFILDRLTENCVACHSKLPCSREFAPGRDFVERARIDALPTDQRVRLFIATRQFERAMRACEKHFRSKDESAKRIAERGMVEDYLTLCLCVADDGRRARATLESLATRKDLPRALASRIPAWIDAIEEAESLDSTDDAIATAREFIHEARERNEFPADRHGTAHFIIASGVLQRFLESRPGDPPRESEAYYLLGVCESHTARSRWVSETEFYLESAVRRAPSSPYARLAFERLEAYVAEKYTGSAGVMIPDDVTERLEDLRRILGATR